MYTSNSFSDDYGSQRITVELANICNLHCSYCFRAEDNLYSNHAEFFPLDLLRRVIKEASEAAGIKKIIFTGGEPTLHPQFADSLSVVADAGMTVTFWQNGITRESHDLWRGSGSFDRLVRAFTRCHMSDIPFVIKMTIRRDLVDQLEQVAMFAAKLGTTSLNFAHVMPTSGEDSALTLEERRNSEQEVALLNRIFKMNIGIDVGYYNIDEDRAPCSPLAGTSRNIDFQGRLSLCCNLSGFRGAALEHDVVADLKIESFAEGYEKLKLVAAEQLERRRATLFGLRTSGITPDVYTGSPCLFCLQSFGKIPWHSTEVAATITSRSLPVYNSST